MSFLQIDLKLSRGRISSLSMKNYFEVLYCNIFQINELKSNKYSILF